MKTRLDHVLDPRAAEAFRSSTVWLNTATVGIPPTPVVSAMQEAITAWERGDVAVGSYDQAIDESRAGFARLVGVSSKDIAIGNQVSPFCGLVASCLPAGTEVVLAEEDFASVLHPFVIQADRLKLRFVPLDQLAGSIRSSTSLVVFSLVQSADGRVADAAAISAACRHHGAATLVDATQAAGWLDFDASLFDIVVAAAYKWLLSPRGTAFVYVSPAAAEWLRPLHASWYAGEDRWNNLYGPHPKHPKGARAFDISPAWLDWAGTRAALEFINGLGITQIHAHSVALANRFRERICMQPSNSAIVSVEGVTDSETLLAELLKKNVVAAVRNGRCRVGFHVCNVVEHADQAADIIGAHLGLA